MESRHPKMEWNIYEKIAMLIPEKKNCQEF